MKKAAVAAAVAFVFGWFVFLGIAMYCYKYRPLYESFTEQEMIIKDVLLHGEDNRLAISTLGDDRWFSRNCDQVVIQKRQDGAPHTSAKFSFTGVTLLVPVDEDVQAWQKKLDETKAKHAKYLESLKPQRVLPPEIIW